MLPYIFNAFPNDFYFKRCVSADDAVRDRSLIPKYLEFLSQTRLIYFSRNSVNR